MIMIIFFQARVSWAVREPDVIARIANKRITLEGDMLANVRYGWYPGQSKEGILRIQNDEAYTVKIDKLEAELVMRDAFGAVIDQSAYAYRIYALTIKDGDMFLYPNVSGAAQTSLLLRKGGHADLSYRVEMDPRCGNELQGSQASITLAARFSEITAE